MRSARPRIRASYALALATLVAGAALGAYSGDWLWLSRAGSLVVVIGILLTSTQIIEHDRRLRFRRMQWEAQLRHDVAAVPGHGPSSLRDWAREAEMRSMDRSREDEEGTWALEHDGLYLLVGGTLTWGFGDLVGLLFR